MSNLYYSQNDACNILNTSKINAIQSHLHGCVD